MSEVRHLIAGQPDIVSCNATIDEVVNKLLENTITRNVFVVDENHHLCGVIRLGALAEFVFPFETIWLHRDYKRRVQVFFMESAEDIMSTEFRCVKDDTTLDEVAALMDEVGTSELPVVDEDMKIVGQINFMEILQFIRNLARTPLPSK